MRGWGGGPGRGPQSVPSSLKNIYGTAALRLPGLAAILQSRARLRMDRTDYCEAWQGPAEDPWGGGQEGNEEMEKPLEVPVPTSR
jgi:hypothetical protein